MTFSRHYVQELLLDFRWADLASSLSSPLSLWNIIIIVRFGGARLVLELCEEEVVAPITNAVDGRCGVAFSIVLSLALGGCVRVQALLSKILRKNSLSLICQRRRASMISGSLNVEMTA